MAETLGYIEMLQDAIRKGYGCGALHNASIPVEEMFQGKTVWKGVVEVFDLVGHPKAILCYAWGHAARDTGNEVRVVTVLGVPPVDSPRKAVQVSIVADAKANRG
jgi:hypothetical protein